MAGSAVGKVIQKVGGKVATNMFGKMSKTDLKKTVTSLEPKIKGAERNDIKNISYLTSNYKDIGEKYFKSSKLGKVITTFVGQVTEILSGIGLNRWFS